MVVRRLRCFRFWGFPSFSLPLFMFWIEWFLTGGIWDDVYDDDDDTSLAFFFGQRNDILLSVCTDIIGFPCV